MFLFHQQKPALPAKAGIQEVRPERRSIRIFGIASGCPPSRARRFLCEDCNRLKIQWWGGILLSLWLCLAVGVALADIPTRPELQQLLTTTWAGYKKAYIQADGRVVDQSSQGISTSEGQSYALLRAVWMNDRPTFDAVYHWTKNNLQVRGDALFAWKWGGRDVNGTLTWDVLDRTAASDGDQDIALALLMAHKRWDDKTYLKEAQAILDDLWDKETYQTPAGRVLTPGDWEKSLQEKTLRLNPSYFSPYAYRIFAEYDRDHRWGDLVESSYRILKAVTEATRTHLPPDWVELSLVDGRIRLYDADNPLDPRSDFGYEAIRVYWRVALDGVLVPGESRVRPLLAPGLTYMARYRAVRGQLPGLVTSDGIERGQFGSRAIDGGMLLPMAMLEPEVAKQILPQRYEHGSLVNGLWHPAGDYYAQNWLWFGLLGYLALEESPVSGKPSRKVDGKQLLERLVRLAPTESFHERR